MGIDIDKVLSGETPMRPSRVAFLLFSQPAGANVWKETGGWIAYTAEELQLVLSRDEQIQIAEAQAGSKQKHKYPEPPLGRIEQRMIDANKKRRFVDRASDFKKITEEHREEIISALDSWGDDWNKGVSRYDHMRVDAQKALEQWEETPQLEIEQ